MRLQTRHNQSKKKATSTVKRNKVETESKLCKNYKSTKHWVSTRLTMPLSKLTFGMIDGYELESVNLPDGEIETKDSWVELILIMLNSIFTEFGAKSLNMLGDNGVTNSNFIIDKTYGRYDFEREEQLKVFKVYDTGYYLEADFNVNNIFFAIVGMARICNISFEEIEFNMVNKRHLDKLGDFDIIDSDEIITGVDGLASELKSGNTLTEAFILGDRLKTSELSLILWIFCSIIVTEYNENIVKTIKNGKNNGIATEKTIENVEYMPIKESNFFVFTNNKHNEIIKFISSTCRNLGISDEGLRFKLKKPEKLSFRYEY